MSHPVEIGLPTPSEATLRAILSGAKESLSARQAIWVTVDDSTWRSRIKEPDVELDGLDIKSLEAQQVIKQIVGPNTGNPVSPPAIQTNDHWLGAPVLNEGILIGILVLDRPNRIGWEPNELGAVVGFRSWIESEYRIASLEHTLDTLAAQESQDKRRMNSLLDTHNMFVIRTDPAGMYTYINETMFNRFAWRYESREKMLAASVFTTVDSEDHSKMMSAVERCIARPGQGVQVQLKKPTSDGSPFYSLWEFVALLDENGQLDEIQCVGFDVTDMTVNKEKSMALAMEQERIRLISNIIQNASHEFRTPLTIINTQTFLLEKVNDPAKKAMKAAQVRLQVKRIDSLIDLLLVGTELEVAEWGASQPLDLIEALSGAIARFEDEFGHPCPFNLVYEHQPIWIDIYRHHFLAVIRHIALHAVQTTGLDPIVMRVHATDRTASISVSDNGGWVNGKTAAVVFGLSSDLTALTGSDSFQGISASIIHRMVEFYLGTVKVHGENSDRFEIVFPLYEPTSSD